MARFVIVKEVEEGREEGLVSLEEFGVVATEGERAQGKVFSAAGLQFEGELAGLDDFGYGLIFPESTTADEEGVKEGLSLIHI